MREVDRPFRMPIEDVFTITGRGTVVTGRIERGVLRVNSEEEGLKFAIREGGRTVGAGQVTSILQ